MMVLVPLVPKKKKEEWDIHGPSSEYFMKPISMGK